MFQLLMPKTSINMTPISYSDFLICCGWWDERMMSSLWQNHLFPREYSSSPTAAMERNHSQHIESAIFVSVSLYGCVFGIVRQPVLLSCIFGVAFFEFVPLACAWTNLTLMFVHARDHFGVDFLTCHSRRCRTRIIDWKIFLVFFVTVDANYPRLCLCLFTGRWSHGHYYLLRWVYFQGVECFSESEFTVVWAILVLMRDASCQVIFWSGGWRQAQDRDRWEISRERWRWEIERWTQWNFDGRC